MDLSVLRSLLVDIRRSEWFSVIADEATDLSQKEQLTLCIRSVVNDMEIHEDPVELIHVPKTDSSTLTHAIKDSLVRLCRPSLFGGLDSGLDCGTGLRDWTHRKLRSSNFEAAHTLLHYSILTSHELNSGQTAITRYQYR